MALFDYSLNMNIANPYANPFDYGDNSWCNKYALPNFDFFTFPVFNTEYFNNIDFNPIFTQQFIPFNNSTWPTLSNVQENTFLSAPLIQNNSYTPKSTNITTNEQPAFTSSKISNTPKVGTNRSLQMSFVDKAKSYLGKVNSDKEGNRLFSNGKKQAWCADFVSANTLQTFGNKLPDFKHFSGVSQIREWGEAHDCYQKIPNSDKASFIANNVHAGDIMIEKRNGKSHTGVVTKVYDDGSFDTVEGNSSNQVKEQHYTANSSTLSGFVSFDKYLA